MFLSIDAISVKITSINEICHILPNGRVCGIMWIYLLLIVHTLVLKKLHVYKISMLLFRFNKFHKTYAV